jgi:hypothetical protein
MPLASSSLVQVRYIPEATFGVIPIAGNPKDIRITGESLDFMITKEESKEINSTRTISSVTSVTASASGGLNAELSYAEYDPLFSAILQSTWTVFGTNGVQGTPATVTATATTLTASVAPTANDAWTGLKRGQWFRFVHPTSANDGKLFRVSTSVAPTTTVITLDTNTPATVAGSLAGGIVQTSRLTHGTTQTSYTIERAATDISQFLAYTGMTPSKLTVNIASGSLTSLSFDFMGKDASRAATTQLPGTPIASQAYDIQSGVSGSSCALWEGGAPITGTFVKSISLNYDNMLRSQEAICTLGAVSIGSGTIGVSGSLSVYFADGALFDKFKANTNSSLIFSSLDTAGNGYVFTIPVVNISSWKVTAGSKDQDLMVDLQFIGLRDAANADVTLRKVLFIDRVGAAVLP